MHGCRRKVHWIGTRIWGDGVEYFHNRPSIPNPSPEIYSNGKTRVYATYEEFRKTVGTLPRHQELLQTSGIADACENATSGTALSFDPNVMVDTPPPEFTFSMPGALP